MNVLEFVTALSLTWGTSDTLQCYSPPVPWIVNPGQGYAVQYIFPDGQQSDRTVEGFGFLNNDGDTVWPSAGVIVIEPDSMSTYRFPTPLELQSLQAGVVPGTADTTVTVIRWPSERVVFPGGAPAAVVCVLEIPADTLVAVGEGPGFAAANKDVTACSFFTLDGGVTWLEPDDYNWAWAVELAEVVPTSVPEFIAHRKWGAVKELYR